MFKSLFTTFMAAMVAGQVFAASAETAPGQITVTVQGAGPDVVLIPGLACSSAVWDATVAHLKGHYRLHLVQVAGFAGSSWRTNTSGALVQPTVEAIDTYIKTNKLKTPAVIGHSLGGLMGLTLVEQHPEDASKLMIVDSLPFFSVLFGATEVSAVMPQAVGLRDTILNGTQDAYADGEKQFLHSLVKSPGGYAAAVQWAVTSDKTVVARGMYEAMTTDIRPKLHGIKTPVTVLYPWDASMGREKVDVDKLYGDNFAALPNKTMVRIDDSYHFIMLDQPEVFAAKVDAFLK
jgi:pimeloyl-ACP methyl ester carboxylesterase